MTSPQDQLTHLFRYQRPLINDSTLYGKVDFDDMKRLDRAIHGDPIVSTECCLYAAKTKGKYAYFSYRGKKVSVLRLLSHNFVKDLHQEDTITYLCENPGLCCNIAHFRVGKKKATPKKEIKLECDLDIPTNEEEIFKMD